MGSEGAMPDTSFRARGIPRPDGANWLQRLASGGRDETSISKHGALLEDLKVACGSSANTAQPSG